MKYFKQRSLTAVRQQPLPPGESHYPRYYRRRLGVRLSGRKNNKRRKFRYFGRVLRVYSLAHHSSLETALMGPGENENLLKRLESLFSPDSLTKLPILLSIFDIILIPHVVAEVFNTSRPFESIIGSHGIGLAGAEE